MGLGEGRSGVRMGGAGRREGTGWAGRGAGHGRWDEGWELGPGPTFMRKKVMLVSRSTVDFRSCSRSGLLAGKLFCGEAE